MTEMNRSSWTVKDSAVAQELIGLLGLTDAEEQALKPLKDKAKALAPVMTEAFYTRILSSENTKEYIAGAQMNHLKSAVQDWFADLFSGQYDAAYAEKRIQIGKVHVRIGLPVRYPLAMLDIIGSHGEQIAAEGGELALAGFRKVLALDIAVFNQAYEDNQLHHLSELMGNERLARRLLQGVL